MSKKILKHNPDIFFQSEKVMDNDVIERMRITPETAMSILFAHDFEKFLKDKLKIESTKSDHQTRFRTSFVFCSPEELEAYVNDRISEHMGKVIDMFNQK